MSRPGARGAAARRLPWKRCVPQSGFDRDEVSICAEIVAVGRTSMRIAVEAWRRGRDSDVTNQVTSGVFTFVTIDAERRPRAIPAES